MPDTARLDNRPYLRRLSLLGVAALALLCIGGLTSCTETIKNMRTDYREGSTLAQDSYGAADMMVQQAGAALDKSMLIEVAPLTDLDYPTEITNFGHLAAGQIASRLVQLGYKVVLSPLDTASLQHNASQTKAAQKEDSQTGATQIQVARPTNASRLVTGRYARARHNLIVNLRLVDHKTGQILASYDYTVDYTSAIKALSQSQAEKLDAAQNSLTIPTPF